ncbi:glutaredoxin family protein [Oerskovia sp. NPDC057915]|uniref:glutaredoxin family protein n=1 Tax=Oerskovia sp. NPDC057915 TaxID=3346280 RepID=UPI0036DB2A27
MSPADPAAGQVPETAAGRDADQATSAPARVVLYGRVGCHLCEDAREVVGAVCADQGVAWTEVDVDSDPSGALAAQYGDYVPVVTVDGVQQGFWQVDGARLARALSRRRATG